ncbi:hypothetical protein QBC36DRAFT_308450 [Triangularia setosa]|uniref:Uncharacterized protein n=1 Tax=Triangularia setosa TaxID=2587417 RepID=A0AAN6WCA1_9PEZI|nr:hypothetical protein QBC36DRAFT_308450 [Podospora setosa]
MGRSEPDYLDLSERGEAFNGTPSSASPISPSATLSNLSNPKGPFQQVEENRDTSNEEVLGRIGCALSKRSCREWAFFPAPEAEFSLALDEWATKAQNSFRQLKALERMNMNRTDRREDDEDHTPGYAYEQEREDLMINLTIALEKFSMILDIKQPLCKYLAVRVPA